MSQLQSIRKLLNIQNALAALHEDEDFQADASQVTFGGFYLFLCFVLFKMKVNFSIFVLGLIISPLRCMRLHEELLMQLRPRWSPGHPWRHCGCRHCPWQARPPAVAFSSQGKCNGLSCCLCSCSSCALPHSLCVVCR